MSGEGNDNIPRNMRDIKGLLKFCIENTKSEDASGPSVFSPMDEERKKWLVEALMSMTESPQKRMLELIEILIGQVEDSKVSAIEELTEWCEDIDLASDFFKMGGLQIIPTLLNNERGKLRASVCELVAVLVQNNPTCQQVVLENKILTKLVDMLENDTDSLVKTKALYAMSCFLRGNEEGKSEFLGSMDGFSVLMRAMQSDFEKVKIKATFLLSDICLGSDKNKDTLCNMGMIEQIIGLLRKPHDPSHEHLLKTLLSLASNHERCQSECQRSELGLVELLHKKLNSLKGKEDCLEELEYCQQLKTLCFKIDTQNIQVDR